MLHPIFVALIGWIPVVVVMFAMMPVKRAAAMAVIGAWLLLPPSRISLAGLPDYSKVSAASLGLVFGTMFFGTQFIVSFRPRWFDVPMLLYCFVNTASSLSNGLGIYDGLAQSLGACVHWGLPYLFGRMYFGDASGLRMFTVGLAIAGVACVIPCLWEIRMSPMLLRGIYGVGNWEGTRWSGYRPKLFFSTGLELGMWMTAASLAAWWLWRCGVIKKLGKYSVGKTLLPILLGTTVLCRSTGALVLLAGGMFLLWVSVRFKTRVFLWALVLFGPVYVALRVPDLWSGENLVDVVATISPARATSLSYRFKCESLLIAQAVKQPVFGWGGWGRSSVYSGELSQDASRMVPPDGLWMVIFGMNGFAGLSLLYLILELPAILFLFRFPARFWHEPRVAPATVAATLLGLYMIDCLLNAQINIIYVALAGGLVGITPMQVGVSTSGSGAVKRASRTTPSPVFESSSCSSLNRDGQLEAALSSAVVYRVDVVDRYIELGRRLKSESRWADARLAWQQSLDLLSQMRERQPDVPELQKRWWDCGNDLAWLLLAHPELESDAYARALALGMKVVDECPECDVYWNTLGVAFLRNGDFDRAVAALLRAMTLSRKDNPFNCVFLAMACARLGDREQAQHWLAQAVLLGKRHYPNHPELTRFCDEVCTIVGTKSEAAPAIT